MIVWLLDGVQGMARPLQRSAAAAPPTDSDQHNGHSGESQPQLSRRYDQQPPPRELQQVAQPSAPREQVQQATQKLPTMLQELHNSVLAIGSSSARVPLALAEATTHLRRLEDVIRCAEGKAAVRRRRSDHWVPTCREATPAGGVQSAGPSSCLYTM